MKITVYLASSMGNPIYRDSVEAFGDWMAQKGYDLVYGGSQTGLMGLLADRVLAHGGKVCGEKFKHGLSLLLCESDGKLFELPGGEIPSRS